MNIKNIEIDTLTDEELKKRIVDINKRQLSNIGYLSLYYSIYDSLVLINNVDNNHFLNLIKNESDRASIKEYYSDLISIIEEVDKFLNEDENKALNKLFTIRRKLYENYILLNSYMRELKYVEEIFNFALTRKLGKDKYKNFYLSDLDLDRFYVDIMNFLTENSEDFTEFNYILGTIIRLAPFRMTKEKFVEKVGENLKINFNSLPKAVIDGEIERIKNDFDGSFVKGYGIKFDYIFRQVERIKKLKIKKLTDNEFKKEINNIDELVSEIETVTNFVKSLGLLTNKLYTLYMSKDIIKEDDIRNSKKILSQYKENIDEEYLKTILEKLQKCIDYYEQKLFETINLFQKVNEEAFNREIPVDENLNIELEKTRKILAYYNDLIFQEENILYYDLQNIPDTAYIEEVINNLLQFLNRNILSMGNLERKVRMKSTLSKLTIPFSSPDEFIKYLEGALDIRVTNKEEIFSSVDDIYYFINFFQQYKSQKDS